MDTSKEYIKMCEKAEEIQKPWKPIEGDVWACPCKACVNRNAKVNIVSDYDIDALNKRDLTRVYPAYAQTVRFCGGDFADHFNQAREASVWLPRQDQLQEMVGINQYGSGGLCIWFYPDKSCSLGYEDRDRDFISIVQCESMEQLWLAFVMKEKYRKTWNGKKWNK